MVDRTEFDARLLGRVRGAGARLFQPARLQQIDGAAGAWRVRLACPEGAVELESRLVLDARGRAGATRSRVPIAPTTVAHWTHIPATDRPGETRLEAIERGWLWGTPVPGGGYRVTAFVDPDALKRCGNVANRFRALLAGTTLFADVSSAEFPWPMRTCSATPYLDAESWRPGTLKIGETALALDPLSSSGVEKSMRLALQAAVAANTLLCDPGAADLAREFYESALIASGALHAIWTQEHYERAWPGSGCSFWRDRAQVSNVPAEDEPGVVARFRAACAERQRRSVQRARADARPPSESRDGQLEAAVELSAAIRVVHVPCAVGDRVESRPAIAHPVLEQPVAFLAGYALVPLVGLVPYAHSLGHLLAMWSAHVPPTTAARIAGWLIFHRVLESGDRLPITHNEVLQLGAEDDFDEPGGSSPDHPVIRR